ncbi:MAG: hypothetical protein FJY76_01685 [Candidatus Aenigmarchaeota archaeon]|nr:hypothetical protein [Candidatus Aenigmarchaeota archaeon]
MVKIDKVDFGEIVVGGRSFYSDVSISAKGGVEHLVKSHIIEASNIVPLLAGNPACVVIGTGMEGAVKVRPEVRQILENKGIRLFIERTRNAVDVFNGLVADRKKVAGLFHVTG